MAQRPGQTVDDGLLILVDMSVTVGMFSFAFIRSHGLSLAFPGAIIFTIILPFSPFRKPGGGINPEK
jgi:hypothetical protein